MRKRNLYKYFLIPVFIVLFMLLPNTIKAVTADLPNGSKNIFVENVDINAVTDDGSITTGGLAAINDGNASVVELINVTNNTSNHGILVANSNGTYTVINIVNDDGNNKVSNNDKLLLNNGTSSINGMFIANTIKNGNMSTVNGGTFDKLEIYYPSDKSAVNTAKRLDFTPSATIDVKAENLKTLNTAYNFWVDKGTNYYRLNKNGYIIDTFNINWVLNGGSVSGNPSTYTLGIGLSKLPTPVKRGYTFKGWKMNGEIVTSIPRETVGDVTLEAEWQVNVYTITYVLNGGTQAPGQKTTFTVEDPEYTFLNPTRKGYIFEGWYTKSDFSDTRVYKLPASSIDNRTLYAKWRNITYTVAYNGNGATSGSTASQIHTYDIEKALTPNGFKREYTVTYNHNYSGSTNTSASVAYTFDGWSYTSNSSVVHLDQAKVKNLIDVDGATVTLYAHWTSHSLNLRTPTRRGYTFAGWYKESGCTNKVGDANAAYTPTANITLYAKWVPLTYTVTYNGNTSTSGSMSNSVFTYDQAATIKTNTYVKTGYEYKGWSTKTDHTDDGYGWTNWSGTWIFINGDKGIANQVLNLYARWNIVTYNITWNLNGGNLSGQKATYTVEDADYALPTPSRTGYTFSGWYTSSNFSGSAVTSIPKGSTGNKTFYAKWTPIVYSISYNLNGGTISNQKTEYTIETDSFTLPTPSKRGYIFTGWTGTGLSGATKTVTVNKGSYGNRSYTANWQAETYTVSYLPNKGTGTMNPQTATYDQTFTIAANGFTRLGYTFTQWSTKNNADDGYGWTNWTGTWKYINGQYGIANNKLDLYALWKINTYTITWNLNGGNLSGQKATYTVEDADYALPTPSRTGYTFSGWYTSSNFSGSAVTSIPKGSTGNKTFYAKWTANEYTYNIKYVSSSGKDLGGTTITKDFDTKNTITAPAKNGYTTPVSQTVTWDSVTAKTITFEYEIVTYTITYNLNGGIVTGNPITYNVETPTFTLKNPTKTGYTFNGWTGSNGSNVQTSVQIPVGSYDNKSYTANFGVNPYTYTVKYVSSSGKDLGSTTVTYDYGTTNTITAPAKTGYTTPASQDVKWDVAANTKVITFTYTLNTYTIGYTLNGGSVSGNPTSYTVESDAITLKNPIRTGYTFKGWTGTGLTGNTKTVTIPAGSTGNKSYTANWSNNSYKIAYVLNSGTAGSSAPASAQYDAVVTISNPTRTGYTFAGWTFNGNTSTAKYGSNSNAVTTAWSNASTKVKDQYFKNLNPEDGATVTMTANWTANKYTVAYNGNNNTGGSTASSYHTYDVAQNLTANGFTRTGYTFTGWNTKADGTGTPYANSASVKNLTATNGATVTLYAQWKINTYTITWNLNGGTQASEQRTSYTVEEAVTFLNPSKTGYTFGGWFESSNFSGTAVTSIAKGTTGNKTYYAKWNIIKYTISYTLNGGNVATANPTTYTVESAAITLNNPTRSGYNFGGWTGTGLSAVTNTVTIPTGSTGNRTYTANWNIVTYSISYNLNGGTVATANPTSYNVETATFTLNNPTKTGYTFTGWTGSNGTKASTNVSVSKGTIGNKTYTANYSANNYNITYTLNGGTSGANSPASAKYDATVTISNPTKTGYTFTGWTFNGNTSTAKYGASSSAISTSWSNQSTKVTNQYFKNLNPTNGSTVTLTANWSAHGYTVAYNGNENTGGSTASSSHVYDVAKTLTANGFTRTGYTFTGWNTKADGTGTAYENQASVTNLTATNGATVTLYAQWSKNKYYLDVNHTLDGTGMGNSLSSGVGKFDVYVNGTASATGVGDYYTQIYYGDTYEIKNITANAGYTYAGLNSGSLKGTMGAGNTSTNLKWTTNSYTLTFNANGGSVSEASRSVKYKAAYGTLPTPTRNYYTFAGWFTAASGGTQVSATTTMGAANTTIYAHWTPVSYTITWNLNGGTQGSGQKTSYTVEDAFTFVNPSRTGYSFQGWYTESGFTNKVTQITKGTTGNKTYYAKWTANNYTYNIKNVNANTGAEISTSTITKAFNTTNTVSPVTIAGYTSPASQQVTWDVASNGGKTITFKYTPKQYTITYNVNGGSGSIPSQSFNFNTSVSIAGSTAISRAGYTFKQWSTNSSANDGYNWTGWSGTWTYVDGQYGIANSTLALYALWTANTYSVAYNGNGATGGSMSNSSHTYDVSKALTANAYSRTGYIFNGWNTRADGKGTAYANQASVKNLTTTAGGTATLYAQWTPISYTINYNGNGNTGGSTASSNHKYDIAQALTMNGFTRGYTVTYNHNYSGSTNSTGSANYTFAGWATTASGAVAYADKASVKNLSSTNGTTITLYAKWNSASLTLATPTRNGYTFGGWYSDSACTAKVGDGGAAYTPTSNITLYAKWTANTYTVKYNGNGATSGSTASSTHTYNSAKALTANGFERAGYTFTGWNTKADGTGTAYANQASVNNLTTTAGGTVNLYAQWNTVTYSISYNLNGGSISGQKDTYTIEDNAFTLPTPIRSGYKFTGWTGSNGPTPNPAVNVPKGSTGNRTYIANWQPDLPAYVVKIKEGRVRYLYNVGEAKLTTADIVTVNGIDCYVLQADATKAKLITKNMYNVRFDKGGHTSAEVEGHVGTNKEYADNTYDYKYSTLRTWMNKFYVNKLGADSRILPTTVTYYTSNTDAYGYNFNNYATGTIANEYVFALDAKEAKQNVSKFRWNESNQQVSSDGVPSGLNAKYFWTTAGFRFRQYGKASVWVVGYNGKFYNSDVDQASYSTGARPVFWISLS